MGAQCQEEVEIFVDYEAETTLPETTLPDPLPPPIVVLPERTGQSKTSPTTTTTLPSEGVPTISAVATCLDGGWLRVSTKNFPVDITGGVGIAANPPWALSANSSSVYPFRGPWDGIIYWIVWMNTDPITEVKGSITCP